MKNSVKLSFSNMSILFVLLFLLNVTTIGKAQGVIDHLEYLAHNITYNNHPPATIVEWKKERDELRKKFLKIINLDPLPEKTPLNVRYVGDKIDLGNCYFQRVVFESRPKIYVAVHLYIPKNVTFPVPAVIYVPGHGRRDKYRPHPRTYAANGFVAIALPMVGEEGKTGTGWGACGEYGPYVGHFNWFNTGYNAIGPTVWDGIRTVDFLLTLTDSNGVKLVDKNKIGMAGLSGGSARTLWTTIADPRISCAVVNEGYSAIDEYQKEPGGVKSTCDIHLFYNFYGLPYGALYSLIAPRPLLVQLGTKDHLYPNPQPVTDYLAGIYNLYHKSDHFSVKKWDQGHGYTLNIWNAENNWMDKWLRKGDSPLTINDELFKVLLTCFPDREPADMQNTEKLYTLPTPEWTVNMESDYDSMKSFLMTKMREEIMRTAFQGTNSQMKNLTINITPDYKIDQVRLMIDSGTIVQQGYFFYKPGKARETVVYISPQKADKAKIQQLYQNEYLNKGVNLYYTEVTGTGSNVWEEGTGYLYDRFAMLVGHTRSSLQVNDIIVAVNLISQKKAVNPEKIYVWGKDKLAVPVMYAAVADNNISGVILENAQDKHIGITPVKETRCSTAMFNILKYADIPQVASLIFPREIILAGEHKNGFEWTSSVYDLLGKKNDFVKTSFDTGEILKAIH